MLLDGSEKGASGDGPDNLFVGQTIEISGTNHYFRTQYEFCDEAMGAVMGATEV